MRNGGGEDELRDDDDAVPLPGPPPVPAAAAGAQFNSFVEISTDFST